MPRREHDKRSAHDAGEDVNLGGGDTLEPIMDTEAATAADVLFALESGEDTAALLDRLGGNGDGPLDVPEDDEAETIQWAGRETTAEDHVGAGETPPAGDGARIDGDTLLDGDVGDAPALAGSAPSKDNADPNDFYRTRKPSKLRLGDLLKEMGVVTDDQVEAAMAKQAETRQRLGRILVEDGVVSELDMTKALAQKFGVAFIDLKDRPPQSSVAELISEKTLRRYVAVPVRYLDDTTLLLAMADPQNFFVQQDLELITGCQIQPAMALVDDILEAIAKLNQRRAEIGENTDDLAHEAMDDEALTDIRDATEEAPIVKLVNSVIAQAVDDAASDIHFEPQAKELVARFRIDGVLHEIMSIPRRMQNGVISRLKIMADLDIAERRVPQDGRIGLIVGGKPIDMRVATLPTVYGEKIVMRLLDKSNVMLCLEDLGFSPKALKRFQRSFSRPYGAILVTGPTGSGKSTTLYAALNILNSPEKNIITVEDPVEYRLTGINQVQVNMKAGLTFSAALRSILRCDPDIVMIGEIRDRETAQIAVESALTGHLVLSTLHTNDAPGALSRLTEMGIEPFLTSSAVDCVLAQRLARRLCKECKEPYTATREMLRKNDFPPEVVDREDVVLYRPKGCPRCNGTGYKGRLGLYEVMIVSEAVRRLTVERKSADEISRVATAEGMKSLREDGIDKVLEGATSVEEIARVIV